MSIIQLLRTCRRTAEKEKSMTAIYNSNIQSEETHQDLVVDTQGCLLVNGIEEWINRLSPICADPAPDPYGLDMQPLLRMKDVDTGAEFAIRREK